MTSRRRRVDRALEHLGFSQTKIDQLILDGYTRQGERIAREAVYLARLIRRDQFTPVEEAYWRKYWDRAEDRHYHGAVDDAPETAMER